MFILEKVGIIILKLIIHIIIYKGKGVPKCRKNQFLPRPQIGLKVDRMLEVKNVTKQFETVTAVKNISFKIDDGRVLGIVGRNGAGKSTIFRMILNLIEPTEGEIFFNGNKIDMTQHSFKKFCQLFGTFFRVIYSVNK